MLDQIVAKFSDAHFLAMLFAAIGSAATVLTAAMPWLQPDTLSRRIKAGKMVRSPLARHFK
jgi:hypothetical protein